MGAWEVVAPPKLGTPTLNVAEPTQGAGVGICGGETGWLWGQRRKFVWDTLRLVLLEQNLRSRDVWGGMHVRWLKEEPG